MSNQNIKTRGGYDYWDKLCAISRYGFIHSDDNSRILKVKGLGNWIDVHAAQEVVEHAQDELNVLREKVAKYEKMQLESFNPKTIGKSLGSVLSMILNALDRDAINGQLVRGEMATDLREAIANQSND